MPNCFAHTTLFSTKKWTDLGTPSFLVTVARRLIQSVLLTPFLLVPSLLAEHLHSTLIFSMVRLDPSNLVGMVRFSFLLFPPSYFLENNPRWFYSFNFSSKPLFRPFQLFFLFTRKGRDIFQANTGKFRDLNAGVSFPAGFIAQLLKKAIRDTFYYNFNNDTFGYCFFPHCQISFSA